MRLARDCVFWPGMTAQIKNMAEICYACQARSKKQQKETLRPTDIPELPWTLVAADLFQFGSDSYLITVYYYSSFWEIDRLQSSTSTNIIGKLKEHFACHGIPTTLHTDNRPQFMSQEFRAFTGQWQFNHETSSPLFPRANGKVENAVKIAKQLMEKAHKANSDAYIGLLAIRNTPTQGMQSSPAQKLVNRRTRTALPMHTELLKPALNDNVQNELKETKNRQKNTLTGRQNI